MKQIQSKNDVASRSARDKASADISETIDDDKLFEQKFNEVHNEPSTQKKPDGRDKTRDVGSAIEQNYNSDPQIKDSEGLM
ncbi:hypothetical protein MIDIC_10048 [Alphaproteobacteria bacterium]